MARILCRLIGHRRDSRRAHRSDRGWQAPCLLCGTRLARVSPHHWRVVLDDEYWPSFPPYARAPRQPFRSASAPELGALPDSIVGDEADRADARGSDRRSRHQLGNGDDSRRMLRDLFDQTSLGDRFMADDDVGAGPPAPARSEAEMFAIALVCCREMLVRLSDRFSFNKIETRHPDEAPPVNH